MIPQALEIQEAIMQKELDSVEENLEVLRMQGAEISRGMLKGLEKRKQTLEAKLQNIQDSIAERKDDAVDFKMMGIDHLFVDESHQFKNLMFNTRHDRVSGLGNPDGSQRAFKHALCYSYHTRTVRQGFGSHFPFRNDYFQQSDRIVFALQIPPSAGFGEAGYQQF